MRRIIKVPASAAGFTALGVGGILFSLLGLPLLRLLPGGAPALQRRTRSVIHRFFRGIVWFLAKAGLFKVRTEGLPDRKALDGTLILATHPGYLDVVILLALLDQLTCVVKTGIWTNPLFGRVVQAAGYLPALGPEAVLDAGAQALARGEALLLFPEGTRTDPGAPHTFHRGAAHLALQGRPPVLPLYITCTPPLLVKGHRWFEMPKDSCDYCIRAAEPLDLPWLDLEGLPVPLAARKLTRWLEGRFNQETAHAGHHPHGDQAVHHPDP
ncbi:lysophospholipid acyltransferase family protein [Geothrix oryzisoli]|uniref:lysophospholipid acyltransferase family protein n=1 Tax=Geothrix oryzisoli TaxID=2922721 RepID=UPI001FABB8F1|nr:lysophospholipid acyltransferase family protein [Geothrix oryzisoli]